jgi:hypothetical protein
MQAPKLSLRTKVALVALFAGMGLVWLYVGSPAQRFKTSEANLCHDKCAKLQKTWRLVPQHAMGMISEGKYDGPWSCQCY